MTRTAEEEVEESVFQQAYIPRNLEEVDDYERDHQRLEDGGAAAQGIYYEAMSGMLAGSAAPAKKPAAAAAELQPSLAAAEPSALERQQSPADGAPALVAGDAAAQREPEDAGAEAHRCVLTAICLAALPVLHNACVTSFIRLRSGDFSNWAENCADASFIVWVVVTGHSACTLEFLHLRLYYRRPLLLNLNLDPCSKMQYDVHSSRACRHVCRVLFGWLYNAKRGVCLCRDKQRSESRTSTSSEDDDDSDDSDSERGSGDSEYEDRPKGGGKVTQEERKAHKKAVKEAARERRKTKTPKHAKKRAVKKKKK